MKPFAASFRRLSVAAPILLTSWSAAFAQGAGAEAASPAEPGETTATPSSSDVASQTRVVSQLGPVLVTVASEGYDVSADEIASAIVRELNVALTSSAASARGTFRVALMRGKDLSVTFRDELGNELKRVVKAPANDAQVPEVAALLAVNLSQDKSGEVLAAMTPPSEEPAPTEPEVTPNVEPEAETASTETVSGALPPPPKLEEVGFNATLVHPLTVVRNADERTINVEFGLVYSRVGALDGFALNPILTHVRHSADGFIMSGVGTISGTPEYSTSHDGFRIGGAFNYGYGALSGFSIAGAVDVQLAHESVEVALDGGQVAGAVAIVNGYVDGAQIGGAVSYSKGLSGMQLSGAASVSRGNTEGFQLGGAANVSLGNVSGAQIAGAVNVAQDVNGLQFGVINIGKRVSGAQIGIINIAEEVNGASVGLVTYSKKGRTQFTTWVDPTRPLNVGARFVSGYLYAMPMAGGDPTKTDEFDFGMSLGARFPIRDFYIDTEGNYANHYRDGSIDESAIDLRYRASLGYQVLPWLGIFAGGGVRHQFHAKEGGDHRLTGIWNVGIDVF